jgi:O-antigen ligase
MFTDTHIRRADGPFEQQIVLSVVAILAFFFILYLRRLMPQRLSGRHELFHRVGLLASLGAALLPLNRGLVFALIPIAFIDFFSPNRLVPRRIWIGFFACIAFAAVAVRLIDARLYNDRVSSPDNVYQRLAQHRETLRFVRDNPLLGVGFGLYHEVATRNPQYMAEWNGIESMNYPHNALMTVLSEEGLLGLVFYVAAQFFLIRAMWRMRKAYPPGWLAFLYCILIYVLTGLDYATVYFSDINLFYIFILGVQYQMQIRMAPESERSHLMIA